MVSKYKNYFLKLLVSLLLLLFLLRYVNFNELAFMGKNLSWPFLTLYFILIFVDRLIMAYKWNILLKAKGVSTAWKDLTVIYFKGTLIGNLLPTSLGGDAVRAYELSKVSKNMVEVVSSIIMERFLGFLSSAAMAVIVSPFLILLFPEFPRFLLLLLLLSLLAGLLFFFWITRGEGLPAPLSALLAKLHWTEKIHKIGASFVLYRDHPKALILFFIWSFGEQLLPILSTFLLVLALGLSIPIYYLVPVIPLTQFFARIPISLSGLGIQEGLFISIFSLIGIKATSAFALGLASNLGNILSGLPGAFFYFQNPSQNPSTPEDNQAD
jgi:glycosyltransferase 2 family protein